MLGGAALWERKDAHEWAASPRMVWRCRSNSSPVRTLVTMSAQLCSAAALAKRMVRHDRPLRIMAYRVAIQREDFLSRSHPVPSIMA